MGLILTRYIIYVILWIFSFEFWLFPNLFDDDKGVVDSFIPVAVFSRREADTFAMKVARIVCLALIVYVGYSIVCEPRIITSFSDASFKGVSDILEWGQMKLEGNASTANIPPVRKSLEQIEEELDRGKIKGEVNKQPEAEKKEAPRGEQNERPQSQNQQKTTPEEDDNSV